MFSRRKFVILCDVPRRIGEIGNIDSCYILAARIETSESLFWICVLSESYSTCRCGVSVISHTTR